MTYFLHVHVQLSIFSQSVSFGTALKVEVVSYDIFFTCTCTTFNFLHSR